MAALLAWVAAGLWLAGAAADPLALAAAGVLGWAVLSLLAWGRGGALTQGAVAAAVLTSDPWAGSSCRHGRLLPLAQLALMLATTVAAAGCWAATAGVGQVRVAGTVAVARAGLAVDRLVLGPGCARACFRHRQRVRVAILMLAFLVPAVLSRLRVPARATPWLPWAAVLLAALPVVLAVAWPGGADMTPMPDTAADPNDPT
ncbi:MAG: hypothetical protein IPF94_15465 [Betaproteobacteria bacterium]|nr:hypothetical protein [Betaproteobacteria bacterium]